MCVHTLISAFLLIMWEKLLGIQVPSTNWQKIYIFLYILKLSRCSVQSLCSNWLQAVGTIICQDKKKHGHKRHQIYIFFLKRAGARVESYKSQGVKMSGVRKRSSAPRRWCEGYDRRKNSLSSPGLQRWRPHARGGQGCCKKPAKTDGEDIDPLDH